MNTDLQDFYKFKDCQGFRPQQGLTIMNDRGDYMKKIHSFRPQQGLTIMNPYLQNPDKH